MHVWFDHVAKELNKGHIKVQRVLAETVELEWNEKLVKEVLWRSVQVALLGKSSTTELKKTEDIEQVYDHLNRFLGEKFGVHVPFPSEEVLAEQDPTFIKTHGTH